MTNTNVNTYRDRKFILYIELRKGVKIYWNIILHQWVDFPSNASPFDQKEVDKHLAFGVKVLEIDREGIIIGTPDFRVERERMLG